MKELRRAVLFAVSIMASPAAAGPSWFEFL